MGFASVAFLVHRQSQTGMDPPPKPAVGWALSMSIVRRPDAEFCNGPAGCWKCPAYRYAGPPQAKGTSTPRSLAPVYTAPSLAYPHQPVYTAARLIGGPDNARTSRPWPPQRSASPSARGIAITEARVRHPAITDAFVASRMAHQSRPNALCPVALVAFRCSRPAQSGPTVFHKYNLSD